MQLNLAKKLFGATVSAALVVQIFAPNVAKADEDISSYLVSNDTYGMCLRNVCDVQRVQCLADSNGDEAASATCEENLTSCELTCLTGTSNVLTSASLQCSELVAIDCQQ